MKPPSMTLKDYLVRNMEEEMGFEPGIVEKVVNFQGEHMLKAVSVYSEIEISGLGTLYVAKTKLANTIKEKEKALANVETRLEEEALSEEAKTLQIQKRDFLINKLNFLKTKCRN